MFKTPTRKIILKSIILTALVMVSYYLGRELSVLLNMSDQYISGMWCAVSAIVVFDDLRENVKVLLKNRLLGTLIGSILTVMCVFFIHDLVASICVSLVLVCLAINLFNLDGALKIACTTVLIITISTHDAPFVDISLNALMRFTESTLGSLLSLAATVLVEHTRQIRGSTPPQE